MCVKCKNDEYSFITPNISSLLCCQAGRPLQPGDRLVIEDMSHYTMVKTNTFNGTSISQSDYHTEDLVYEINFEAARLASEVARALAETK